MVKLIDYAGEKVRTIWRNPEELRATWMDIDHRNEVIFELEKRALNFMLSLTQQINLMPIRSIFYAILLPAPVRSRRDRAAKLKTILCILRQIRSRGERDSFRSAR